MPKRATKYLFHHVDELRALQFGPNRNLLNPDDVKKSVTSLLKSGTHAEHTKAWAKATLYTWLCRKYNRVVPVVLHSQMRKLRTVLKGDQVTDEVYFLDDAQAPEWLLAKYREPDPEAVWWYTGLVKGHADEIRHVLDYVNTLTERQYKATVEDCITQVELWDRLLERQKLAADLAVGCTKVWGDSKTEGALYVVNLNTPGALTAEGQAMKHCVGGRGYAKSVQEGVTKIFSLRRTGTVTPVATIEVRLRKPKPRGHLIRSVPVTQANVVQIKGPCNQEIEDADAIAALDKLFFVEVCPLIDATLHTFVPSHGSYAAMLVGQKARDPDWGEEDEDDEEEEEEEEEEYDEAADAEYDEDEGDEDGEDDDTAFD